MSILCIGLFVIIGAIMQGVFIINEHKEKYVLADLFKGLASLCFVIIGLAGYISVTNDGFGKKILIGLIFGLIGDVVMNLRFVLKNNGQKAFLLGILAFLIGHVMYLLALLPLTNHVVACVCIGAVIAALLLLYIFKTMDVKIAFKIFGVFYLGAIMIMTVIAIDIAVFMPSLHNTLYALGAVLFMASDIVLIFNTFSGVTRFPLRVTNLSLYYVGQLLIAGSLFIK